MAPPPTSPPRITQLSVSDTVSLATALLTAAENALAALKKKALPQGIEPSRQRLIASLAALLAVTTPTEATKDPTAQRTAQRAVDIGWTSFHKWLYAFGLVPNTHQQGAADLSKMLFPKGVAFLKFTYRRQYAECDSRLRAITPDHEAMISALKGSPFLNYIREAHAAFGAVLGITEVVAPSNPLTTQSEYRVCLTEIRVYCNKAYNYIDQDIEGSEELAISLLEPLRSFKPRKSKKQSKAPAQGKEPPATPTPGALAKPKTPPTSKGE